MERLLANQFENGPLVRYEAPEEPKRFLTAPAEIANSKGVIVRRAGPDLYVPANQSAAMPVPKPRGIAGARLRDVNAPRDRRPGSSIHSGGTDPQPPPRFGLKSVSGAVHAQPMNVSLSHWH